MAINNVTVKYLCLLR